MKKQNYILHIDKPCQQEWTSMSANDTGKFCSHCSTTVIDFSKLSDKEVLSIIKKAKENLCGRLTTHQLNRVITAQPTNNHSSLYKILVSLLLAGAAEHAVAANQEPTFQETSFVVTNELMQKNSVLKDTVGKDTSKNVINGMVLSGEDKTPLDLAVVFIKGTRVNVSTDSNGHFQLVIPDSLLTEEITLVMSYPGYERTEAIIKRANLPLTKPLVIMAPPRYYEGEIEIKMGKVRIDQQNK